MAAGLAGLSMWFHWVFLQHAGGLWRDEAGFVAIATRPDWSEVWTLQALDHCPILPFALVRWWCAGPGATDSGLRVFGLLAGVLLLIALWTASRTIRRGVPVLAFALVAVNLPMLRYTDALRGYGIGCALSVFALAAVWRLACRATWGRVALAAVVAVASVQSLYQNAFFLLAAGCGGMLVCALRREWRGVLLVASVGVVAALSLVPYVPLVRRAQEAYVIVKNGFDPATGWHNLALVAGYSWPGMAWVWVGLAAVAAGLAACALRRRWRAVDAAAGDDAVVYAGTALVVGVVGFGVFLKTANFPTQSWYYVPLLVFVAACLDVAVVAGHRVLRWVMPVVAVAAGAVVLVLGAGPLRTRQTNIDQLAQRLTREAVAEDFILVHPWYAGITFARYYQGTAKWETLPPLSDHGLHRYDLLKERLQADNPVRPVLAAMAEALRSGHRVWVVGGLPISPEAPPPLAPAPATPAGWSDEAYSLNWAAQAGQLLALRAQRGAVALSPTGADVNPFEAVALLEFSGWRWQRPLFAPQ